MLDSNELERATFLQDNPSKQDVLFELGGTGETIRIKTGLKNQINLFDLTPYKNTDPTVRCLKSHSIDDILSGKYHHMHAERIIITRNRGSLSVEVYFSLTSTMAKGGVNSCLTLNRNLENVTLVASIKGALNEHYTFGLACNQVFVEKHQAGVSHYVAFEPALPAQQKPSAN